LEADEMTYAEVVKYWLRLTAEPPYELNILPADQVHTVIAMVEGPPGWLEGYPMTFAVLGSNANVDGDCSPENCETPENGQVSFTYWVPIAATSLGMDRIQVGVSVNDQRAFVEVFKEWGELTPPEAACVPLRNPRDEAKGTGGQSRSGFYQLIAEDNLWPEEALQMYVTDMGSGVVFGPYPVGTKMKYTEANGAQPSVKPLGGVGGTGETIWHITGNGDAAVTAVDGWGNESPPVECFVPPPPTELDPLSQEIIQPES
jgi:hypothetical protein